MTIFKPKSTEDVLALLGDRLTGRPEEPEPERGPDDLYELLTALSIRGHEFRIGGTEDEPKVQVHPHLDLMPEERALMRANREYVLAWVTGVAQMREPRRRLKLGVRRWLNRDLESREWVLGFWDRPERGQRYVRGQLWQVVSALDDLGVEVRQEERREILPLVVMEVAAEIASEVSAA